MEALILTTTKNNSPQKLHFVFVCSVLMIFNQP
jgi:hypothetical protein